MGHSLRQKQLCIIYLLRVTMYHMHFDVISSCTFYNMKNGETVAFGTVQPFCLDNKLFFSNDLGFVQTYRYYILF